MIEESLERRGVLKNFKLGYSEGVELTKNRRPFNYVVDNKSPLLEKLAYDLGSSFAWFYYPYIHPKCAFNNLRNESKNITDKKE